MINPKGAIVSVSGIKNNDYLGDCNTCPAINGVYMPPTTSFPPEGCSIGWGAAGCPTTTIILSLVVDPANNCLRRWEVTITSPGGAGYATFGLNGIKCCYEPQTLLRESSGDESCLFGESEVSIIPVGEWTQEELAAATACIPQLSKVCPPTYYLPMPLADGLPQDINSLCGCEKCASAGPQPKIPSADGCPTCSTGQTTSPINGNLSVFFGHAFLGERGAHRTGVLQFGAGLWPRFAVRGFDHAVSACR